MKRIQSTLSLVALLITAAVFTGCDKYDPYETIVPPSGIHFTGSPSQTYNIVVNPAPSYTVGIGTTDVLDRERSVSVNVTSRTGAQAGVHYTLVGGNTAIIPAGETLSNVVIQANYDEYTAGRIDTLTLSLTNPQNSVVADFLDTITLVLRGPCFEGDLVLTDFLGVYANTHELFNTSPYGPYTTTIPSVNQTSATTGQVTVTNIYDFGWNPIVFNLDWTDPDDLIATLDEQSGIGNAGTLNSAYSGMDISVRPIPTIPGTFSWCDGTLSLVFQPGVTGLGWFTTVVIRENLAR